MMRTLRRARLRLSTSVRRSIADPALDVLGAGVLGTLSGRVALFGLAASAAFTHGAIGLGVALAVSIAFDLYVHLRVLGALRRLMAYEVVLGVV